MRIILASLLLTLSVSVSVADSSTPDAKKMVTDDCARATKQKKDCVLNMESHDVGGETASGSGMTVDVLKFFKANSLIRIRRDFIPEIIKTAEDL